MVENRSNAGIYSLTNGAPIWKPLPLLRLEINELHTSCRGVGELLLS